MEQVKALYDSINGLQGMHQLLADRAKEDIHLEFKTKKNRSTPELEDSDSWQFSRALSGFANSDGGVLVWGMQTDKDERAFKLKPITNVSDFEARLKKSLLNSVQPFVDGVKMSLILEDVGSGAGYLKILIPRSDKAPHRAMRADREYFRRSIEGFYRLEHFDLEDAFGRRPHPALIMTIELVPGPEGDPHEDILFAIRNDGRGMARYIGSTCEFSVDVTIINTHHGWKNYTSINQGRPVLSYTDNVNVYHAVPVTASIGRVTIRRPAKGTPLPLTLRWYCEGMMPRTFNGSVPPGKPSELSS